MKEFLIKNKVELVSLKQAGIDIDIIGDGATFEANAFIKAREIAKLTDSIVLADDSGLEVDYMDHAPGIYSARFLGEDTSYTVKNNYIIKELKDANPEERTARFVCVIACVMPDGSEYSTKGVVEGEIAHEIMGAHGFGYDPIFYLKEYGCTTAQLSPDKKNEISHRGLALSLMMSRLEEIGRAHV